jgi:hypothetical protein
LILDLPEEYSTGLEKSMDRLSLQEQDCEPYDADNEEQSSF